MNRVLLWFGVFILCVAMFFALRQDATAQVPFSDTGYVRIVPDDVVMNRILVTMQSMLALQTRAARGSGMNRPVSQVGDALKVWVSNVVDPCSTLYKGGVAISQTATTKLVPGQAGQRIFICSARVVAGAAEIASFTEGTGTTCGTGTAAVSGSTTAANGESYAANGGFSGGNGTGAIMVTNKEGDDLCLQQSGTNRLSGNIVYAYGSNR